MSIFIKGLIPLFFCMSLISVPALANIDESQIDLYYANGMLMDLDEVDAQEVWRSKVEDLKQYNPKKFKKLNAKMSYNSSALGGADDGTESLLQWIEEKNLLTTWATVVDSVPVYLDILLEVSAFKDNPVGYILGLPTGSDVLTFVDLGTQIDAYKKSIESGHGVIVVAHSQGNFFTNKAYLELDSWMRPYFNMISVASPS